MKKSLLLVCIISLCAGCMRLHVTPMEKNGERSTVYMKDYTIGRQIKAYRGQPMVRWQEVFVTDGQKEYIVFEDEFSLNFHYIRPPMPISRNCTIVGRKGYESEIEFTAEYGGQKYFIVDHECESGFGVSLLISEDGKLNTSIIANGLDRVSKLNDVTLSPPTTHFSRHVKPDKRDVLNGITHELIFGGVNNVSINVTYRKYASNNMARQAFYQNIIYQTAADIIHFQNFKIKVHEVTNEKIVFTIIEDGLGAP